MVLLESNVNVFLRATKHHNNVLAFIILLFPSINVVEGVVAWKCKPLDLALRIIHLVHDTVLSVLFWVKFEHKTSLSDGFIRLEFKWQVWDDNMVLGDWEIMDHSLAGDVDIHSVEHLSIFVEDSVVNDWFLHVITESKELTCHSIDLWVSRYVVLELSIEIVATN